MNSSPVVFLAFANDLHHPHLFLDALEPEKRGIQESLGNFFAQGGIVYTAPSSHTEWLMEDLIHFHENLTIFHFSGHANGTRLQLEDPIDAQASLHKERLRDLLKSAPALQLVLLNACATADQVQVLKEVGIPAVIATNELVNDDLAQKFAIRLYQGIGKGLALEDAFDKALASVDPSNKYPSPSRSLIFGDWEADSSLSPWSLFVSHPEIRQWRLPALRGGAIDLSAQVPRALNRNEFVGREQDLRKLMHLLQRESSVLLLNGLGGIGKTTLAKEYIYRHQNEYRHIAWVDVLQAPHKSDPPSGSVSSAIANNINLFAQLGLAFDPEMSEKERFERVVAEMNKQEGPNLLVIDNVGASILAIHDALPKAPGWKILTTSRLELAPFSTHYLDELPLEEAERLFTTLYPEGKNCSQDVRDLLTHIGCHTLTIELLARICKEYPSLSPAGILHRLSDKQFEQLSQSVWSHHSKREIAVYGYLMGAFSLSSLTEEEQQQLTQWAVLPSVFVDWETMLQLFNINLDKKDGFEKVLRGLWKKGWITREKETGRYRCHQLIQELIRYQFSPDEENCRNIIDGVGSILTINQSNDNIIEKFPLTVYGEALLSQIQTDGEGINVLKNNLALVYKDLGRYEDATKLMEAALASGRKTFDEEHPSIARYSSNLALVYTDLGRYEEAADLLKAALASDRKHFGEEYPSVAISTSNLALVYKDLGRYEEAADLLEAALISDIKNFEEEHPTVAKRRSNLALVYQFLGRYEEAADLLEAALISDIKNFDNAHPNVARSSSNLAGVYQDLGRYDAAVELFEAALASDRKNFGEEHPNVAKRNSNLALVYQDMGRYEDAAELLEAALASNRKHFGHEHPYVAISSSNLALVYINLGRYEAAVNLLKAALASDLKHFGEKHPTVSKRRSILASAYSALERYEDAAHLFEAALESDRKNFGEEHPTVAIRSHNLATAYKNLGKIEEARQLFSAAYIISLNALGARHPTTITVKNWLDSVGGA